MMQFAENLTIHDLSKSSGRLRNLLKGLCDDLEPAGARLLEVLTAAGCKSVVEERDYVDSDYRAGHLRFYYLHHLETPRRCTRLHFFASKLSSRSLFELSSEEVETYLGFTVIRPLPAHPSGTTVIRDAAVIHFQESRFPGEIIRLGCTAQYGIALAGNSISFAGVPWMQQDQLVSACASVAMWVANWHLCHRFPRDFREYSTSLITDLAFKYPAVSGRAMPSEGLGVEQMLMALMSMGYHPISRIDADMAATVQTIYHYLTSSIPVLLILNVPISQLFPTSFTGHAITLVGYNLGTECSEADDSKKTDNGQCGSKYIKRFIAQDDSGGPCRSCEFLTWSYASDNGLVSEEAREMFEGSLPSVVRFEDGEIAYLQEVLIPLHLRVTLSDSKAHQNAMEIVVGNVKDVTPSEMVLHTFLIAAIDYKEWWAPSRGRSIDISNEFRQQPFPRWIWVTEYGQMSHGSQMEYKVLGHVVQDCSGRGTGKVEDDLLAFFSPRSVVVVRKDGHFDFARRRADELPVPSILEYVAKFPRTQGM